MKYFLLVVILIVVFYLMIQGIRCIIAVQEGKKRLETYKSKNIELSYGYMSYVDSGSGEVILSIHGIFGGYDQAYDTCSDFSEKYRILAPSRFGYLGSDTMGSGTPKEQAKAYVELLDALGIPQVYVLATSAGGSVAIRLALDYPERIRGLILFCSAMPPAERPVKCIKYAGPPKFICNDYGMFLISPLFKSIMGMESSLINSMLPISKKRTGVVLDASVTNLDMIREFDDYTLENIQLPVLVIHAKDDKLACYTDTKESVKRLKNCRFISFETGGHLLMGHGEMVKEEVLKFAKTP